MLQIRITLAVKGLIPWFRGELSPNIAFWDEPGIEVPIERLLPKYYVRVWRHLLNNDTDVPLYRAEVRHDVCLGTIPTCSSYIHTSKKQCMHEGKPWVLCDTHTHTHVVRKYDCVRDSTPVWYTAKHIVMSDSTSSGLLGTFQLPSFQHTREWYKKKKKKKKNSEVALSYLPW